MAESRNSLHSMPVTLESSNQAFGSSLKSEISIQQHQSNSEISDVYANSLSGCTNTEHACSYSKHSTGKALPQRLLDEEATWNMAANKPHCQSSDGLSSVSSVWPQNATTEFSSFLSPFNRTEYKPHSTKIQDFSLVFPKSDANNQAHKLLTCSSSSSSFQSSGVTRPAAHVVGPKTKSILDETAAQSHLVKMSQIDSAGCELGCSVKRDALAASGSMTKFQCMEKQLATSKGLEPLSSSDGNLIISTTSLQSPSMLDGNLPTVERPKKLMGTKIVQRNHGYECSSVTLDCEFEQPASTTTCAADENEPIVTQISVDHGEDSGINELVSSSTTSTENLEGIADSSTPTLERRTSRKPTNKTKSAVNVLAKIAALGTEPDRQQFLENLFTFMESRGTPVTILPVICRQAVDLYKLYHLVKERGGMVEISKGKRWRDVASAIGIGGSTSAGFTLKRNYGRYLFPYECKFDRDDIDPVPLLAAMETPKKDSKRKAAEKERDIGFEESQSSLSHVSRAVQSVRTIQNSDILIAQNWQADDEQVCNDTRDTASSVSCSSSILLPCSESRSALSITGYQMGTLCTAGNASSSSSESAEPKSELCVSSSYASLQSVRSSRLSDDRKSSDYVRVLSPVTSQSRNSLTLMLPNGQNEGLMGFQLSTSVQGFVRQEKDSSISSRIVTSESECKVEMSDSIGSLLIPQLAASRQAICTTSSSQNSCIGKNSKFIGIKANHEIEQQNAQLKSSLEISSTDGKWEIVRNNSNIGPTNQGLNGQNASTSVMGLCSSGSDSKPSGLQLQDVQLCPSSQKNLRSNKTDVSASISRYDTIFPPDSIEAEQPIHQRRNLLTHKDIGLVDLWRVMMCLRSGLIAESTWAIDVLSVLLHDNYTASAFCLNSLPGLLEILLEYLGRYLIETFGAEHFRSQEVFNPSIEAGASIDSDKSVLSDSGTGLLTRISRKRKASENNEVSEINSVLSTCAGNLGSDGDIDAVFDSSSANWQMGRDDSAIHIMTHIATDNNSFHEKHFFGKNYAYLKPKSLKCHFGKKLLANERYNMVINSIDSRTSDDEIHKSSASRTSLNIKLEKGNAFDDTNSNISLKGFINNCSDSIPKSDNNIIQKHSSEAKLLEDMTCHRVFRFTCSHFESLKSISSDIDEETDEPDDHLVLCHDDSKAEIASRGLCISRIIRNLSLINGNEIEMAKHHGLIFIISKLLLLHHSHRQRRADYKQSVNSDTDEAGHKWWWDTLTVLREHCLVILTSISGQLDLSAFPESICLPLLDSLLHWSICQSSEACDPLPGSTLSVSHLVLETLSKLCIVGSNVDMIIATPPFSRIVLLLSHLSSCLSDKNQQVVQELSLGLVSRMVQANDSAARALALERSAICYVFEFIEGAERQARMVASMQGIEMLQGFPETIGTSVDMLCRAANILHHLAQIPANKSILLLYQNKFLQLIMSQILDCKVTTILADVFGIINST